MVWGSHLGGSSNPAEWNSSFALIQGSQAFLCVLTQPEGTWQGFFTFFTCFSTKWRGSSGGCLLSTCALTLGGCPAGEFHRSLWSSFFLYHEHWWHLFIDFYVHSQKSHSAVLGLNVICSSEVHTWQSYKGLELIWTPGKPIPCFLFCMYHYIFAVAGKLVDWWPCGFQSCCTVWCLWQAEEDPSRAIWRVGDWRGALVKAVQAM